MFNASSYTLYKINSLIYCYIIFFCCLNAAHIFVKLSRGFPILLTPLPLLCCQEPPYPETTDRNLKKMKSLERVEDVWLQQNFQICFLGVLLAPLHLHVLQDSRKGHLLGKTQGSSTKISPKLDTRIQDKWTFF